MFGTNEIKGAAFFKEAGDRLLVTSRFLTLQGEGPYQGRPALFIRLAHCNLNCSFCDTWFEGGDWYSTHDLLTESIRMIKDKYSTLDNECGVVITGGEPSLQSNIAGFLLSLEAIGIAFTQIESNGIIPIEQLPKRTKLVISPKCSEKTNKYFQPHAKSLNYASCLKFVLSSDPESPYHTIPDWAFEWKEETGNSIYISPMNIYRPVVLEEARRRIARYKKHDIDYRSTIDEVVNGWDDTILDREANRVNHNYAAQYCMDKGLFLTLQMQLYAQIA